MVKQRAIPGASWATESVIYTEVAAQCRTDCRLVELVRTAEMGEVALADALGRTPAVRRRTQRDGDLAEAGRIAGEDALAEIARRLRSAGLPRSAASRNAECIYAEMADRVARERAGGMICNRRRKHRPTQLRLMIDTTPTAALDAPTPSATPAPASSTPAPEEPTAAELAAMDAEVAALLREPLDGVLGIDDRAWVDGWGLGD